VVGQTKRANGAAEAPSALVADTAVVPGRVYDTQSGRVAAQWLPCVRYQDAFHTCTQLRSILGFLPSVRSLPYLTGRRG